MSESVAESINPEYFKDPYLVAKQSFDMTDRSPNFDKRNVFGTYSIKTQREKELQEKMKDSRKMSLGILNDDEPIYYTPRNDNKYVQPTVHQTNEVFDTNLRKHKHPAKGTSIMSGEINKINKFQIRTYDQEKLPYAGSSIDLTQPDLYRYDINHSLSKNNPLVKCRLIL